jgi:predicted RNA-binding protein with PUA-like domain
MVDVKLVEKFKRTVTLKEIKNEPKLADMKLVQKGVRLSVQPVTKEEFQHIAKMAKQ